jgi:Lysozyme like domain
VPERLDGIALGCIAAGGFLVYAGIQGKSIPSLITGFIQGKSPSAATTANQVDTVTSEEAEAAAAALGTGAASTVAGSVAASGLGGNAASSAGSYASTAALEKLWTSNGGAQDTAAFAAAVAMAESGGNPDATSSNPDGGTNVGIFQLDTPGGVGAGYTVAQLKDPNLNTQITVMHTDNGTDWSDWGDPVTAAVGYHYTPGEAVP